MIYRHLKILSGCDNFKYFRYFRPLSNALVKMKQRQYLHNVFSYLCIYLFYFLGKIVIFFFTSPNLSCSECCAFTFTYNNGTMKFRFLCSFCSLFCSPMTLSLNQRGPGDDPRAPLKSQDPRYKKRMRS